MDASFFISRNTPLYITDPLIGFPKVGQRKLVEFLDCDELITKCLQYHPKKNNAYRQIVTNSRDVIHSYVSSMTYEMDELMQIEAI